MMSRADLKTSVPLASEEASGLRSAHISRARSPWGLTLVRRKTDRKRNLSPVSILGLPKLRETRAEHAGHPSH